MFSSTAIDGLITVVSDEAVPLGLVEPQIDGTLPAAALMRLADTAFDERDWASASAFYLAAIKSRGAAVDYETSAIKLGRSLLYTQDFGAAARILELAAGQAEDSWDAQFYCGRALQYLGDYEAALERLTIATILRGDRAAGFLALGETAHAMAFGGYGVAAPGGRDMATMARMAYERTIALDGKQFAAHVGLIRLHGEQLDLDKALSAYSAGLAALDAKSGRVERLHIEMATVCCRLGAYDQARALIPDLGLSSNGKILARRIERLLCHVPGRPADAARSLPKAGDLAWFFRHWSLRALAAGALKTSAGRVLSGSASVATLVALDAEFLVIAPHAERGGRPALAETLRGADPAFGGIRLAGAGPDVLSVRRTLLVDLLVAKGTEVDAELPWDELHAFARRHIRLLSVPGKSPAKPAPVRIDNTWSLAGQVVVLLSRSGYQLAGGGDQFLQEAGAHYATHGAASITLGLDPEGDGKVRTHADGTRYAFLPEDPARLRQWLVTNGVTMLHTMSGLGQTVIDASEGLDVRLVYGVHHWREFVLSPIAHPYCFPSIGKDSAPRATAEFRAVLARFDFVYVNSDYVRDLARDLYHVDLPIIPSLVRDDFADPDDTARAARDRAFVDETLGRDFVLLANARHDKGYSLILDVAERLPEISFVVIASQSQGSLALRAVHRRGLANVKVIERVRDMRPLYQAAKIVAVPSHEFTETFGRVAIEASRFGKPVLMADNGNLVNLTACDADLLPNDAAAWADAIAGIFASPAIENMHRTAATLRSARFSAELQSRGFARIVDALTKPRVLVAVGSGIGNMCHTTPLIRALSEHYGTAVDVVMCGDHDGGACVVAGAPWVGTVSESVDTLENRPYDVALITHSYGSVTPRLNARHLIESRTLAHFDPGADEHEAVFNVSTFAQVIEGLHPGDVAGSYFLGGWTYRRPGSGRIALHAGCKKGIWTAKRWPHFAELAGALRARGHEVISVGTADEYVPGTTDLTGGPIEDMIDSLASCDLVVSNDSGVMNLANALGIPVVALFGPTNAVTRGPINPLSRIVAVQSDCSPCEASHAYGDRFKAGTCDCMRAIGVRSVLDAAVELLSNAEETLCA